MLCLPKENADAFKRALKDGTLKIPELIKMSTENARSAFAKVVGDEYAEAVNTMFESKLILKDQQAGLIDFIKTAGGLKPEARYDLIARVQRRQKVFTPADTEKFLNDYADATLGTAVTREEAARIFELTKKVESAKAYTGVNDTEDLLASFEKLDPKDLSLEQKAAVKDLRGKFEAEKAAKEKEAELKQTEKQKISERIKEEKQRVRDEKNAELKRIRAEKKAEAEKTRQKAQEERIAAREKAKAEREAKRDEARDKKLDDQLEAQIKRDVEKREKEIADKEFKDQETIRKAEEAEEARLEREIARENDRLTRQERVDQEKFETEQERMTKNENKAALERATGESLKALKKTFTKITGQKFKGIDQFSDKMQAQLEDLVAKREAIAQGEDRMIYGRARVELRNYARSLSKSTPMEEFKSAPFRFTAGLSKSLKATFDNSVLLRQGLKTLLSNPNVWLPNAAKTFKDIWDTFGGKEVMDEIDAGIISSPNYDNYVRMNLAVNTAEELHPSSLPEQIPYLGRAFAASENAFTGFLHRTRADLADRMIEIMQKNDVELSDENLQAVGKLINSQTGRGTLGKLEKSADTVNMVFFSLRNLKADFDTLTAHMLDPDIRKNPFARKQAAYGFLKVIGGIATILAISKAINPNSVTFDPRSSDFGKIKIGDTRFNVSLGMGSIIMIVARLLTQETVDSQGNVHKINSGDFGAKTGRDVLVDFFDNKLSPMAQFLEQMFLTHKDHNGQPLTPGGVFSNLFAPLPFTNAQEILQDPNSAPFLASVIADSLGVATNTYPASEKVQHAQQTTDLVKKNYEAKQAGQPTKSAKEIAQAVYGTKTPDQSKIDAVQGEMDFYRAFGEDNKYANTIHDAQQASDVIDELDKAKEEMASADFRKFYNKALDSGLISAAMDKKWQTYQETGVVEGGDTNLDANGQKTRTFISILTSFAKATGTSPIEAFKLLLKNQSIRTTENGTIIVNRNTNFFDTQLGKNGYSDRERTKLDAAKNDRLDHIVPIEGGGQDEESDLQLIPVEVWKKNSQVENFVGKALKDKKITGGELREYIIRYKAGQGEPLSPELNKEYQKKYAGVPLTFDEIRHLVK